MGKVGIDRYAYHLAIFFVELVQRLVKSDDLRRTYESKVKRIEKQEDILAAK